jgi:hypothetical protein
METVGGGENPLHRKSHGQLVRQSQVQSMTVCDGDGGGSKVVTPEDHNDNGTLRHSNLPLEVLGAPWEK